MSDDSQTKPEPEGGAVKRIHPAWWVLAVIVGITALLAIGYAVFARPTPVGPDNRANSAISANATSGVPVSEVPTVPLTASEVNRVLAVIDYTESDDSSQTSYDRAIGRMLDGIDLLRFAKSTLEATPSITYTDVGSIDSRVVRGAEKTALVNQAIALWIKSRDASGTDSPPLNNTIGVRLYPPVWADRNPQDSLFEVMAQGLQPLGLMFGGHDADDPWGWHVTDVSVVGTDSADVTYSASATPTAGWRFAQPGTRYTKRLEFALGPDGRWRLSGWSNYWAVLRQFEANVTPPGSATNIDEWWSSL